MDKAQTRKRQNRTTYITPDLRKAHSDIARGLSLENNTKEIHAFLFIRIVFFRFNLDILNFWANIILIYS